MTRPRAFTVRRREGLRVAIAGGGTGGHVFPALAVAEAVKARSPRARVLLMGSTRGIEAGSVVKNGFESVLLESPRWTGGAWGLPFLGARVASAVREAHRVLKEFAPHAVVGAGGYASVAPALAAKALRLPVVILEQNVIPGRANRLLSRVVDEVHTQFAESVARFPQRARVRVTGNPVRADVRGGAARRHLRPMDGPFTLLVMGGSQGAQSINRGLWGALPRLGAAVPTMRIYHCAGARDEEEAKARLFAAGLAGRAWGFCNVIQELYAEADLVVSRAGATSLAERAAFGLPSILVPYPHARDGHQDANARVLEHLGACRVVRDSELDGERFAEAVLDLAFDPVRRARMAAATLAADSADAASVVARRVEALAGFAAPERIVRPAAAAAATVTRRAA
ncbi:MAG: undecaprenyldiphospho-muramoylpentapeptide beta-N-acetylglucosaminyltransferase [Planctomycetota bacterium]|jgi:UDP-N-acetylglucosamine--N-acetylmuramyl-(pentapeptide) pyrophosphoryl-undecaprenol N-acetylglucosamine transferase